MELYSTSLVQGVRLPVAGKKYVMAMHISLFAADVPTVERSNSKAVSQGSILDHPYTADGRWNGC